jgi:isocitrate dehydrogenase (NAD+)
MKLSDGLFLACARETFAGSEIEYDERIIDAGCMRLVQNPTEFDILLCENLYGDVVSDLCAGLVGGLGVTPGANIGANAAVFEAVHGSAPDLAGLDRANPLALLMSAVMLLNHLSESGDGEHYREAATRIRDAYDTALRSGEKTVDIGGSLGTREFTDAVISHL